jgi:hypothetical protein
VPLGHLSRSALVAIAATGVASALGGAGCSQEAASGGADAEPFDAGRDVTRSDAYGGAPPDVRTADAYGGAPSFCDPPAVTPRFDAVPPAPPTAPWGAGACTSTALEGFVDACVGAAASLVNCTQWRQANPACATCLVSPEGTSPRTMFTSSPSVTAADDNALALPGTWVRDTIGACLNHFAAGCGESYFTFANCLGAACDDEANCRGATGAQIDACQDEAIGGGQGVCGAPAIAALGSNGKCRGVFPEDAGAQLTGRACFARPAEDTTTEAGVRAFFVRVGGYFCGSP